MDGSVNFNGLKTTFLGINKAYFKLSNCSPSKLHNSSTCTPLHPIQNSIYLKLYQQIYFYKDKFLPNSRINSVKTPGSLSIKHQLPALSAISKLIQ